MSRIPLIEKIMRNAENNKRFLENLLNDYEKVQSEGEDINITDSGDFPMIISTRGNRYQEKREGYNKINIDTLTPGYINSSGTINTTTINSTSYKSEMTSAFIKVIPNTSYKFIIIETEDSFDNWFGIGEYETNSTDSFIRRVTETNITSNYIEFTTSENCNYVRASARNLAKAKKIMLYEYDGTDKKYEDYGIMPSLKYKSPVRIVEESYEILLQNKNIIQIVELVEYDGLAGITFTKIAENKYLLNGTVTKAGRLLGKTFKKVTDEQMTLSVKKLSGTLSGDCVVILYKGENSWDRNIDQMNLKSNDAVSGKLIETGLKNDTYQFGMYIPAGTIFDNLIIEIQLEPGETATEIIEPQLEKFSLTLPEGIKLYDKNDGFIYLTLEEAESKGLTDGEGWYAINYLNEFVVDGENYKATTCDRNENGSTYINIPLTANLKRPDDYWSAQPLAYCNYLKNSICNLAEIDTFAIWDSVYNNTNDVYVRLRTLLELNTYDEVNEYFKSLYDEGNPLKFVLELETPTYTKITDKNFISQLEALQKAFSYYQVTNITANSTDDLDKAPLYLSVEYLKSQRATNETLEKIKNRKNCCMHFCYDGKEPYWDTNNQTLTIYKNCPIIVNNQSYYSDTDTIIQLENVEEKSYIAIFLDTKNYTNGILKFVLKSARSISEENTENLALFGLFNLDRKICETSFNININGNLKYSKGIDIEMLRSFFDALVDGMNGEKVDIFDIKDSIDGEYYDREGELQSNPSVSRTPLIYLKKISKIYNFFSFIRQAYNIAFFDKNKRFLTNVRYIPTEAKEFETSVPDEAYYVSVAFYTEEKESFYVKGLYNLPSKYANKKMNCLGDSITYGYIPDDGAQMENPYPKILKEKLGLAECRNYGISGSKLATSDGTSGSSPMSVRYAEMDNDADIISVFGGTNDYNGNVYKPALGTIEDTENTTVYGALNTLCEGLINKYPRAFIFFITPLRRADRTGLNDSGYTLEDVSNAIKEVCYKYSIPVLDLYSNGGFHVENEVFRGLYGGNDKLHPNQAFITEHLSPMIENFIRSNY